MNIGILPRKYLLLACLTAAKGPAQSGARPGDSYKEYAVNLRSGDNWRFTDSKATHSGAAAILPHLTLIPLKSPH